MEAEMKYKSLLVAAAVGGLLAASGMQGAQAQGYGWGMMGGYGPGAYGHMGGYGPGYSGHMGYGYGPGWMHQNGRGYGARGGYGPGYGRGGYGCTGFGGWR
jgi:hypothetical protein